MVPEDKVVLDLDHTLLVLSIVFLNKKKKFGLNGRLIVIFLLILNEFHSNHRFGLVVKAFQDLSEGALANLLNNLESKAYLIVLRDSIVTICVIIAIVDDSFGLGRMNFVFI